MSVPNCPKCETGEVIECIITTLDLLVASCSNSECTYIYKQKGERDTSSVPHVLKRKHRVDGGVCQWCSTAGGEFDPTASCYRALQAEIAERVEHEVSERLFPDGYMPLNTAMPHGDRVIGAEELSTLHILNALRGHDVAGVQRVLEAVNYTVRLDNE